MPKKKKSKGEYLNKITVYLFYQLPFNIMAEFELKGQIQKNFEKYTLYIL